ncbi:hypothetical protein O181_042681 [Austropuccinia psidii MF-1]|uniref:Uncharacterized protein n=1 Tax=Austropuccinia psidii MF-1 TaxID=1389203 RepID=A0A9Q3DFA7_9BASI|nr:hypothetical protein [Austropuccinia psidii MF-1]
MSDGGETTETSKEGRLKSNLQACPSRNVSVDPEPIPGQLISSSLHVHQPQGNGSPFRRPLGREGAHALLSPGWNCGKDQPFNCNGSTVGDSPHGRCSGQLRPGTAHSKKA